MKRNDDVQSKNISTSLNEYVPSESMPWDIKRAYHVLKRLQYGANKKELDELLDQNPTEFIDKLIDDAINQPLPVIPDWVAEMPPPKDASKDDKKDYIQNDRKRRKEYKLDWVQLIKTHSFREKMVLFWHNHFVTEVTSYKNAPLAYRYVTCLREHCLGNFKNFTYEIGLEPAMLIYLDGFKNTKKKPNENYARELLELFTVGIGHYTEDDIREIARALTGYRFVKRELKVNFDKKKFDKREKTFFERTGTFNYEDTINIIFEERATQIANFICTKIYKYFVYDIPNQSIIDELAKTFTDNNFKIEPVIRQLLKSEHFFDTEILSAKIKSPVDFVLQLQNQLNLQNLRKIKKPQMKWLRKLGQELLNPINVAGWVGYHSWISEATLATRWDISNELLNNYFFDYRELANSMSEPDDPNILAEDLANYFISVELIEKDKDELVLILLSGMQEYEWSMNKSDEELIWRIKGFIRHLLQLPEYQLM